MTVIATTLVPPLFLQEIELSLIGEIDLQTYYIYHYRYRPGMYIVYIGEGREQGIVFRQSTLERVKLNIERFLASPRPLTCP